jgi:hypothetical protein
MADRQHARNDEVPWSDFDADGYWKHNYASVLPEDAEIIRYASDFLIRARAGKPRIPRAVDVGAGTNLYPALMMLPWIEGLVFTEYARANIDWLAENLTDEPGEWAWQPFWNLVANLPGYRDVEQPRSQLAASSREIRLLSVFDLPRQEWDLGSMFFVADGMSSEEAEFEWAVRSFLGALTPGAPFMMAFMEGSAGYDVSGVRFPGVRVTPGSLDELLARLPVTGTGRLRTNNTVRRLRPGYDAMLLVTGYVADDGTGPSD